MIMKYSRDAVKLALLLPLAGRSAAQMLGPDESSITGLASPPNFILYEETATDKFLMSQPLRIESDVPVTVQRYDDINYVIAAGPISERGEGAILVTSNCDTGATDVVPTVEISNDGNATLVSVKLGVTGGGGSLMPFLNSSSYEAVFYENSYIQYTAADIQPEDPIVKYVPCMTEAECRVASREMSIKFFYAGEYATSGCFYKADKAYWSTIGDPAEGTVNGIQQRVWCKEVYYIDDVAVDTDGGGTCATQDQCDKKRLELGIKTFVPGTFPTKGCFSKTGVYGLVAYWSEGGTADEMSSTDLPGVQERITCDGDDGSTPPGGTECESGPMADLAKSCESGQFCQLDVGVCNTKNGVFTGACEMKPEICIEVYDPVCGCDGATYGNECVAHGQGVSVSRVGECDVVRDSDGGTCTTQDQCDQKRLELGIKTFVPGTFPTKGCFSKTGVNGLVAYWSEGGTADEMSSTDLPGVQERITCDGTECESGPMADPAKSCESGQFCQLDVGVCDTKNGVFAGSCAIKPEACIEIYDPVCGCDGATYGNGCVAHGQGVSISRVGECDEEVFTASQAVYIATENIEGSTSSASSIKGFVLGTILNNVVSSQVIKSPNPRSRLLQDTCTYNVEILLSGCYAGTSAQIEVAAPKARVINSVMEVVETETVAVYESSAFEDTQFYGKEFKHTATLTFPDDQEQLIDGAGDAYASVPPLDDGTCITVAVGRPFIDSDGHSLVASSISANVCSETSSWLGDTSVLAREGELMKTHAASAVNMTNQHGLGEIWTRNALGEHASVASFAAFSIALMTNHAPSDLVEDSLNAALDEVRHAKTSFAIASRLLGKDVTPGPLPSSKHQFSGDLTALAISVAKEGCVEETLSALAAAADVELINEVLENGAAIGAKYSGIAKEFLVWIRDELRTISMDESNHSALAWRTLDWVCRVDSDACYAAKQRVLDEHKLIEAFQRRFGQNHGYSSELSERMMMAWRNIYTGQGVPQILIGSASIDDVVEEVTGNHASNPSFVSVLVENISRGGSYRT